MAFNRPPIKVEHLLFGGQPDPDNRQPGVSYIAERPAAGGISELIRIIGDDEDNALLIYISSDEEEGEEELVVILEDDDGEDGAVLNDEGRVIPARPSDDEDELGNESNEESGDEETDDSNNWGESSDWTSEDSGYDTMSDEEEDEEDENGDDGVEGDEEDEDGDDGAEGDEEDEDGETGEDNIRPLRFEDLPSPSSDTWSCLWDDGSSEEPTPSTAGLRSSTKRSWEGCWEVAAKRSRWFNDSDSD